MVKISIKPSALVFRELPANLLIELQEEYNLEVVKRGYEIKGKQADLYSLLFRISFNYDVELI